MKSIEETLSLFDNGFSCSQCVVSAFASDFGINEIDALKVASGFGGGMGRMQKTCGAVTGAFIILGLKYGNTIPNDKESKQKIYAKIREFNDRFEKIHNVSTCLELLGYDLNTEEGNQKVKELGLSETKCKCFISDAIKILQIMLKTQ